MSVHKNLPARKSLHQAITYSSIFFPWWCCFKMCTSHPSQMYLYVWFCKHLNTFTFIWWSNLAAWPQTVEKESLCLPKTSSWGPSRDWSELAQQKRQVDHHVQLFILWWDWPPGSDCCCDVMVIGSLSLSVTRLNLFFSFLESEIRFSELLKGTSAVIFQPNTQLEYSAASWPNPETYRLQVSLGWGIWYHAMSLQGPWATLVMEGLPLGGFLVMQYSVHSHSWA